MFSYGKISVRVILKEKVTVTKLICLAQKRRDLQSCHDEHRL